MRTTLTLDEDIAAKLKAEQRKTGHSLKDTVNDVLRRGFTAKQPAAKRKFTVRDVGLRIGFDFERSSDLIERLEGLSHQ